MSENLDASPKSRGKTLLFVILLGGLGGHRFYVNKTGTGLLYILLTILGIAISIPFYFVIPFYLISGIFVFIDLIKILLGKFKDKDGLYVSSWTESK